MFILHLMVKCHHLASAILEFSIDIDAIEPSSMATSSAANPKNSHQWVFQQGLSSHHRNIVNWQVFQSHDTICSKISIFLNLLIPLTILCQDFGMSTSCAVSHNCIQALKSHSSSILRQVSGVLCHRRVPHINKISPIPPPIAPLFNTLMFHSHTCSTGSFQSILARSSNSLVRMLFIPRTWTAFSLGCLRPDPVSYWLEGTKMRCEQIMRKKNILIGICLFEALTWPLDKERLLCLWQWKVLENLGVQVSRARTPKCPHSMCQGPTPSQGGSSLQCRKPFEAVPLVFLFFFFGAFSFC